MSKKNITTIHYRRKRAGKTNYKKRLNLLKTDVPRLVIRRTNKNIVVQLIKYSPNGDVVLSSATTAELKKLGWTHSCSNIPAAYLTGLLLAKKTSEKSAIIDLGLQTPLGGTKIFAAVKGAVDGGLSIKHEKDILPSEDRIIGKHIAEYSKKTNNDKAKDVPKAFDDVKSKILEGVKEK
ncbi:MAG: 50S ribosomal protein L18 [archaeon]